MFYFLHSPLLPSLRAKRGNPAPRSPSLRAKRGNPIPTPRHCERSVAIQYPGHRIWGSVLPFRPPRASNLGGRFTLPTTPSIEFGGHFHLPDSSEVKFGGHSCIIDLPDTLIWGSFLLYRPARHPNLGVILLSPTCPTP